MKFFMTGILTLLCSTILWSQPPAQKIEGIEAKYIVGDMVKLKLSDIEKRPDTLKMVVSNWSVLTIDGKEVKADIVNDVLRMGTGPRDTRFIVNVAVAYVYVDKAEVVQIRGIVNIGTPPPDEPIKPTPKPDFGPERFGLATYTYNLAKENKVPVSVANSLGKVYETVSTKMAAGALTQKEAIKELEAESTKVLKDNGVTRRDFDPFFTKLEDKFFALQSDAKTPLKTPDDFKEAFLEVSKALKEIK